MTHKKVINSDAGTTDIFGGNDLDKWSDFASGVDTDDYDINSDFSVRSGKRKLRNPANTFDYIETASAITANRTITEPLLTGNDTRVYQAHTQTLTGKTISAESNTIPLVNQPCQTWSIYYSSGTIINARNNRTGIVVYTDASGNINTVLNSIINAISPAGTPTSIEIGEGDFKVSATINALDSDRVGNIRIKGQGIGVTNLIAQTSITGHVIILDIKGAVSGTGKNLTVNGVEGSLTLTVSTTDAATFAAGDYILLRSSKDFSTATSKRGPQGEIHRIRAINTGTGVINLDMETFDTYNTADTSNIIKLTMLRDIAVEDLSIKVASGYTATNAHLKAEFVDNLLIRNVEIVDSVGAFNSGIYLASCLNFDVDRAVCVQTPGNAYNNQYGVYVESACQNGRVFVQGKGKLRHTFTTGGRSFANNAGACRNITVSGTSENTGAGHFDTHADSQGISFVNCNVVGSGHDPADVIDTSPSETGVNTRSRDTIISNCSLINCMGAAILNSEDANNTVISGCRISRTKRTSTGIEGRAIEFYTLATGVLITGNVFVDLQTDTSSILMVAGSHDVVISNNMFLNCGPIEATSCNDVVVTGNRMKMGSGIKAIDMKGTSDRWIISGNNATGSATSTFTGAGTIRTGLNINL